MLKKLSLGFAMGVFIFGFGVVNTARIGSVMADYQYEEKKKEKKETDDGKTVEKKKEVQKKDGEKEVEKKTEKTEKNY